MGTARAVTASGSSHIRHGMELLDTPVNSGLSKLLAFSLSFVCFQCLVDGRMLHLLSMRHFDLGPENGRTTTERRRNV